MKTTDRFINAFDSIFLVLIMGWSFAIVGALIHPQVQTRTAAGTAEAGTVEVVSLANAEWLAGSNAGQRPAT